MKRLLFILLVLPAIVLSGDYPGGLRPGETEMMHYEVSTFHQNPGKAGNELTVSISNDDKPIITVTQTIEITGQNAKIISVEKYDADSHDLLESRNLILLPPEVKERIGTDSVEIVARPDQDKLVIKSNFSKLRPAVINFDKNLFTGLGYSIFSRLRKYTAGASFNYKQINLVNMTGIPFQAIDATDSVVSMNETVTTTIGEYDCIKIMKLMPDIASYIYISKEGNIPVMVEAFDRETNKRTMAITIDGYRKQ